MKTNNKEACNLCNVKRKHMVELACGISTCGKCIEKSLIENQSSKRYKCTSCSRNHNIKDEQVCKNVKEKLDKLKEKAKGKVSKKTKKEQPKPQVQANNDNDDDSDDNDDDDDDNSQDDSSLSEMDESDDAESNMSFDAKFEQMQKSFIRIKDNEARGKWIRVAKPEAENYEKRGFDYKTFSNKPMKKFNLNVGKKVKNAICQPILDNKIVFAHGNSLSIRDQDGNILKTAKVTSAEEESITNMCLNNRYVYISIENYKIKKTIVKKFNYSLECYGQEKFDSPCFSLAASNDRVFFVGVYGYEHNPHPILYALDADALDIDQIITYEYEDEETYCLEKLAEPPRSVVHGNRIYFCYENYNGDKFNQLDYAETSTLHSKGQLMMPAYFMHFQIDAKGNFVYYHLKTKSFSVHGQNGKLIKRVKLDKDMTDCIGYCITNDGKLVILESSNDIEIY